MNIESNSNSKNHSPCKVVSKYFQNSPVMDESLSEFKEKKGSCKGPKNSQKSTEQQPKKTKQKKPPKRIKGQKDIRTVLKSKKNDQLTYAKEFDEVCKQAGVDIDSEQLQLAIALSKSLQSSEDNKSSTSQKPLSSQERTKKIRTTLQEYGFAIPEIKITNKRRLKRPRKQYKLLLSSDTEKQQIISDRYSQVLFTSSLSNKALNENDIDYSIIKCYHVATGISYETLQNNNILYVEDLVEKSTSKGRLLRDWADIPGRPKSPVKQESTNMNFSEIECSQDELDIVLSGTLKSAKDIVKKKVNSLSNNTPTIFIDVDTDINHSNNDRTLVTKESNNTDTIDCKNGTSLISNRVRSCSPDIFDDEVSVILTDSHDKTNKESEKSIKQDDTIMDLTGDEQDTENAVKINDCQLIHEKKQNTSVVDLTQTDLNNHTESEQYLFTKKPSNPEKLTQGSQNYTRRNSDDFMEITECVGISAKINPSPAKEKITASQDSNDEVRRYSDEFMEVIACVAKTCSQASSNENPHITSQVTDKTKRKSNDFMEMTECVASTSYSVPKNVETDIDLTQQSDENERTVVDGTAKNIVENVDLSQSSNEDELPIVEMSQSNKSLDDTILLNNDEIDIIKPKIANNTDSKPIELEETLDLSDTSSPVKSDNYLRPSNHSFFDEFVHNHSDDASTKETLEKSCEIESQNQLLGDENDNDEVDLTQSSNSSVASREVNFPRCIN
ncbi:uncharacterized protein LOC135083211 [Ostrinia nubilalis]|uniref:uncharacterized protein LOC135083211 n=1 Tax=Ostrinia nubilalis TaxID=29057 RepID=UPI0030825B0D